MSTAIDAFYTIDRPYGPQELLEKGSRFIAYLFPAQDSAAAEAALAALRREHHSSTHVCYAYRLVQAGREECRSSDDGEPGGTAGLPIANEIRKYELHNVLAAVVRYYGGVKLGTGGLTRAYGQSAERVLQTAHRLPRRVLTTAVLHVPFALTGEAMRILERHAAAICDRRYHESGAELTVSLPLAEREELQNELYRCSRGELLLQFPGGEPCRS